MKARDSRLVVLALAVVAAGASCSDSSSGPATGAGTVTKEKGGTVALAGGLAVIEVPPGAVDKDVTIRITATTVVPSSAQLVSGTSFNLEPSGQTFSVPVTLRIKYDAAKLPAGSEASSLRVHKAVDNAWQEVPGSTVDVGRREVVARLNSFSTYGALTGGSAGDAGSEGGAGDAGGGDTSGGDASSADSASSDASSSDASSSDASSADASSADSASSDASSADASSADASSSDASSADASSADASSADASSADASSADGASSDTGSADQGASDTSGADTAGSDSISCPAGSAACGGQCVNPNTNPLHCGGCNKACGTGEVCIAGVCKGPSL